VKYISAKGRLAPSLLERLLQQPGHLIRRAHQRAWAAFLDETRDEDVTPVQFAMLIAVSEFPGIDATGLSRIADYDRATIGDVLGRLEAKGLVTRTKSRGDRRAKQTVLTARGRSVIKKIEKSIDAIADRIFGSLTSQERRTLAILLGKLVEIDEVAETIQKVAERTGRKLGK
jgi:DNA-binding MarR family transcriptional regulator